MASIAFDQDTATTHTVVVAQAGKKVVLYGWFFGGAGSANTIKWQSDATEKTGAVNMGALLGSTYTSRDFDGLFHTGSGEALKITMSAANQVSGIVFYDVRDA